MMDDDGNDDDNNNKNENRIIESLLSLPMIRMDNFSFSDSIALQRFNAILLHESFGSDVDPEL